MIHLLGVGAIVVHLLFIYLLWEIILWAYGIDNYVQIIDFAFVEILQICAGYLGWSFWAGDTGAEIISSHGECDNGSHMDLLPQQLQQRE